MSIASRIYLIRNAKETIDLQYYIWTNDFVGNLILHELLKAADRGIKIRLLIDDQNGIKLDGILRSLYSIPTLKLDYLILINFDTYVSLIISSDLKSKSSDAQ